MTSVESVTTPTTMKTTPRLISMMLMPSDVFTVSPF